MAPRNEAMHAPVIAATPHEGSNGRSVAIMARRGDGLCLRGKTFWLDFTHDGRRHYIRLGKGISRTVAGELAQVQRAQVLKGEAGIGGQKRKDVNFDDAAKEFLAWAAADKRPKMAQIYRECLTQLSRSFKGKRLSELHLSKIS